MYILGDNKKHQRLQSQYCVLNKEIRDATSTINRLVYLYCFFGDACPSSLQWDTSKIQKISRSIQIIRDFMLENLNLKYIILDFLTLEGVRTHYNAALANGCLLNVNMH